MVDQSKQPGLVGAFIRKRREALSFSQKALGMKFSPAVTTQFISNVERGVTPLPPSHVPTLTQALQIPESELLSLMEREYTLKLSGRLGKVGKPDEAGQPSHPVTLQLQLTPKDAEFLRALYEAYRHSDDKTREAFGAVCESLFNLPKKMSLGKL